MRTVRLITCNDSFQARIIKGTLENEGIAVALHNENTSNVLRGMPVSITGVDILVYEDDYEKAMSILEDNQMIEERLIYCPYCGSKNIKFGLRKNHKLTFYTHGYACCRPSGYKPLGIYLQRMWKNIRKACRKKY